MTASQESPRVGVAVMSYSRESRPTSVCDRECMSGSVWIGALHIRPEHSSCPFVATSVLESPNSFDYIFKKGDYGPKTHCTAAVSGMRLRRAQTGSASKARRDAC